MVVHLYLAAQNLIGKIVNPSPSLAQNDKILKTHTLVFWSCPKSVFLFFFTELILTSQTLPLTSKI